MDYTVPVTQARAEFADLMNRAAYGGERIVVTRHGKPIGALISAADLERLEALDDATQDAPVLRLGGGIIGGSGPQSSGALIHDLGAAARRRPE